MTGGSSGVDPCFVVVGDPCSEFVRTMVRLAREYQVEAILCEDVYSAVAATARAAGRSMLVVGPIRELAKEDNRFFQIAEANSLRCCCLVEKGPILESGGLTSAVRTGAAIVSESREIRAVLKEWLATGGHQAVRRSLYDLAEEDLRATEAELTALLGHGTDA